jgi:hypothetical protein
MIINEFTIGFFCCFNFLNKAGSVVFVNAFEKNVQIVVYIRRNWMAMSSTLSIICALESSVTIKISII